MTRIDFYFNVEDKLRHLAQLAEAAITRQRRIFVFTPDAEVTARLEAVLWESNPTGFLPHCRSNHRLVAQTPIVLGWDAAQLPHDDILINLHPEQPLFFSRFRRLIELVGVEDDDKAAARGRFRFYRDRGYELRSQDVTEGRN